MWFSDLWSHSRPRFGWTISTYSLSANGLNQCMPWGLHCLLRQWMLSLGLVPMDRYYRTDIPFINICTGKIYAAVWLVGWHWLAGMMPNKPSSGFPFLLNYIPLLQKKWTIYTQTDSVIKLWSNRRRYLLHRSVCEHKGKTTPFCM